MTMDYIVPETEVLEVAFQAVIAASQNDDLVLGNGGDLPVFEP
mgnify:CR=1 FL=1